MNQAFDIQAYMTRGVERVVQDALRATLHNPRQSTFMARFALASAKASRLRAKQEAEGLHVPAFLIASITSSCNLHCAGCYSRSNHATVDQAPVAQLTDEEWLAVFREADSLGVSFILLAGGEPMLRRGVIAAAGRMPSILFPIFTNGTFLNDWYLDLFDRCRNLIPVMSIEGDEAATDARRGTGVYQRLIQNMEAFQSRGLIFGASVTVTTQNLRQALSEEFLDSLADRGCRAVFFIEYVPVTEESQDLAPGDEERAWLQTRIGELRQTRPDLLVVSFPGDEKSSGGCLAAGRGFFHINSHGGAEPCPFSPYSDLNVSKTSLRQALRSPLFMALRSGELLLDEHEGGCVLYEKRAQVEEILQRL